MSSKKITFEELVKELYIFRKDRGWLGLEPVDLVKSIMLEAAELLEHYQWDDTNIKKYGFKKDKNKYEISLEIADIFIYILEFCQENDIDLLEVTKQKIKHISKKYPAEDMKDGGYEVYENTKKEYRKNN